MKLKFLPFLLVCGIATAQEPSTQPDPVNQQFGYVEFGVGPLPFPLPIFGAGYRSQWNQHGIDISGQITTVLVVTAIQTNIMYDYYFKPSEKSQFYTGVGIAPVMLFNSHKSAFGISPEFVFGKQYRNENQDLRFFQLQINFPLLPIGQKDSPSVFAFPVVTLSYGIGF